MRLCLYYARRGFLLWYAFRLLLIAQSLEKAFFAGLNAKEQRGWCGLRCELQQAAADAAPLICREYQDFGGCTKQIAVGQDPHAAHELDAIPGSNVHRASQGIFDQGQAVISRPNVLGET